MEQTYTKYNKETYEMNLLIWIITGIVCYHMGKGKAKAKLRLEYDRGYQEGFDDGETSSCE
jgi:hypothetical protein